MLNTKFSDRLTTGYNSKDYLKYYNPNYLNLVKTTNDVYQIDYFLARTWNGENHSQNTVKELHLQLDSTVIPDTIIEEDYLIENSVINIIHNVEFESGVKAILNLIDKRIFDFSTSKDEHIQIRKSYYLLAFCFIIINAQRVVDLLNINNLDESVIYHLDKLLIPMELLNLECCPKNFISLAIAPEHRFDGRIVYTIRDVMKIFNLVFKG